MKKIVAWLAVVIRLTAFAEISPTHLSCEYLSNPLGIDSLEPRLTWELTSKQRAEVQTAYQILVASSKEELKQDHGDLWDTGKIDSDQTCQIAYAGKPLTSRQA